MFMPVKKNTRCCGDNCVNPPIGHSVEVFSFGARVAHATTHGDY